MPTWVSSLPNEKASKRGSYCNWESVVAHANYRFITMAHDGILTFRYDRPGTMLTS